MPESGGQNIEIAHHLQERDEPAHHEGRVHQILEVVEALILALIAVTTAWSGYQGARWDANPTCFMGNLHA